MYVGCPSLSFKFSVRTTTTSKWVQNNLVHIVTYYINWVMTSRTNSISSRKIYIVHSVVCLELSGHILWGFFFELQKKFIFLSCQALLPSTPSPRLSGRATKQNFILRLSHTVLKNDLCVPPTQTCSLIVLVN